MTYGYTAAGFTGWMPCCDIADAIVGISRTHLENLKNFIESPKCQQDLLGGVWTDVVYGDTDSMFVIYPG